MILIPGNCGKCGRLSNLRQYAIGDDNGYCVDYWYEAQKEVPEEDLIHFYGNDNGGKYLYEVRKMMEKENNYEKY